MIVLERATYLSFALPDLVGAIALAYAASHWVHFLYGSFALLVFAEAVLFVPFAVVAMRASFGQIEPSLEESARSLGSGGAGELLARDAAARAARTRRPHSCSCSRSRSATSPPLRCCCQRMLYTLGTEFNANSSTVAFAAAAPFAGVLIVLALVAAYVLMSRFGEFRSLRAG